MERKYMSRKAVGGSLYFRNRGDYTLGRFIAYDLHLTVLPPQEKLEDGKAWTRMSVEGPEYLLWTLLHRLDAATVYYETDFGMLVD